MSWSEAFSKCRFEKRSQNQNFLFPRRNFHLYGKNFFLQFQRCNAMLFVIFVCKCIHTYVAVRFRGFGHDILKGSKNAFSKMPFQDKAGPEKMTKKYRRK
jgi:hypothetical protein